MRTNRLHFYDPLYDFVTFEEASRSRPRAIFDVAFDFARAESHRYGDSISPFNEEKSIIPFLSSVEFSRQSFLRQSNLAFLVYPSATHTRLAHAIGACYLGFVAAQRVAVRQKLASNWADFSTSADNNMSGDGTPDRQTEHSTDSVYLSGFLEDTGWREEFYLALLLHDVGHFPFSHALENNVDFWRNWGAPIHHEEVACQLILGQGEAFNASTRRIAGIGNNTKIRHPHLSDLFARYPEIDRQAICYLISGYEDKYITHKSVSQKLQLRVLHELVSGLLDLDRVDHYRRDNLFTGIRPGGAFNYPGLLSGITICYDPNLDTKEPEVCLSASAIGHAIALLQSKERLTEDCFEHADNIAYEAMLHHAFNMAVLGEGFYSDSTGLSMKEELRQQVWDLLLCTDEEVLISLEKMGNARTREIIFRIKHRDPYNAVSRLTLPAGHNIKVSEIRQYLAGKSGLNNSDVIVRVLGRFGTRRLGSRTGEWLDLERLLHTDGTRLSNGRFARQIEHFKEAQDFTGESVWVYVTEEDHAEKVRREIPEMCKKVGCKYESLW